MQQKIDIFLVVYIYIFFVKRFSQITKLVLVVRHRWTYNCFFKSYLQSISPSPFVSWNQLTRQLLPKKRKRKKRMNFVWVPRIWWSLICTNEVNRAWTHIVLWWSNFLGCCKFTCSCGYNSVGYPLTDEKVHEKILFIVSP